MSRFTADSVERVKESADVVEIISAHTELRRAGERYTGLCPFHEERTPSFSVDAREKLYHCFGCGVGGDVIKFVEEKEGLGFPEAVEALADRYGVELEREREDPKAEEARKRRGRLRALLDRTTPFYAAFLWDSPEAGKARKYLVGRGLGERVLRDFGVGYAPSAWDTVLTRGQRAGFSVAELQNAGLVIKGQKGGFYDRFRSRIMFPIRDRRGRVQGFGGRALRPDQQPKYMNSPEGELYRKSETLFGVDRAEGAIAKTRRALVVEGYTDVLAAHQAGLEEAVGVMGTAITPGQLARFPGYVEHVVLAMDADSAGREAILRAEGSGKRSRLQIVPMPQGRDPAELLTPRNESERDAAAASFREAVTRAEELPAFHVRTLLDESDLSSPEGRDAALDTVVPVLAAMPESISRDELERDVVNRLDVDPGLVTRRIAVWGGSRPTRVGESAPGRPRPDGDGAAPAPRALSSRERRERALLAMCIASPVDGADVLRRLTAEHLSSPAAARARDWLTEHLDEPMKGLPRDDEELVALITQAVMQAEREPAGREAMELNLLELELRMVEDLIDAAEKGGGDPPIDLQRRRADLAERIARQQPA